MPAAFTASRPDGALSEAIRGCLCRLDFTLECHGVIPQPGWLSMVYTPLVTEPHNA